MSSDTAVAPDSIVSPVWKTADAGDPHVGWTVQQLVAEEPVPFPGLEYKPETKFNPSELPIPENAKAIGLLPQEVPPVLVDENHVTQSPMTEVDRPSERRAGRREAAERDAQEAEERSSKVTAQTGKAEAKK